MKIVFRKGWVSAVLLIVTFLAITPTSLVSTAAITIEPTIIRPTFTFSEKPTTTESFRTIIRPSFTLPAPETKFDFEISASPAAARVIQGRSVTFEVFVKWLAGTPEPVTFDLLGSPDHLSYRFSSSSVTPTCCVPPETVSLTINTANNIGAGQTYTLTISGTYYNTGDKTGQSDVNHAARVTLYVDYAPQ